MTFKNVVHQNHWENFNQTFLKEKMIAMFHITLLAGNVPKVSIVADWPLFFC